MKPLIAAAVLILFSLSPAVADEKSDVLKITKVKIDNVIEILKNKGLEKEEKKKRIVAEVDPIFDFEIMARLSLGKKHWTTMNPAQRKEFSDLFVQRLKESYLDKLDLYSDEDVIVENAKQVKSNRIEVLTRLVSKDDKKDMVYKFYKSKKGWMVYDVVILGVSVVQTYRSQFNGLLKDGSMEDLLARLRTTGGFQIPTGER